VYETISNARLLLFINYIYYYYTLGTHDDIIMQSGTGTTGSIQSSEYTLNVDMTCKA
jgi:hypothetical protein